MASPLCQVKFGAGAYASTTNGINATAGAVVVINLISSIGAPTWAIACVYADDLSTVASVNASLTIDPVGRTATFTAPVAGRGYIFQSTINAGNNLATNQPDPTTATTFGIWVPTASGARVLIPNETFESSATSGWVADVNFPIRNPSSGGTVPTGTGIPHIVGGVQSAAASLIVDADVSAVGVSKLVGTLPVASGGTGLTANPGAAGELLCSGYTTASGVVGGAGFLAFGATPPAVGALRFTYAVTDTMIGAKDSTAIDRKVISRVAADSFLLGDTALTTQNWTWNASTMTQTAGTGGWIMTSGNGINITAASGLLQLAGSTVTAKSGPTFAYTYNGTDLYLGSDASLNNRANTLTLAAAGGIAWTSGTTTSIFAAGTQALYANGTTLYLGTNAAFSVQHSNINAYAAGAVALGLANATYLFIYAGNFEVWKPLSGSASGTTPLKFAVSNITPSLGANTLTAAQYACPAISCNGTPGGAFGVVAPLVVGAAYDVYNNTPSAMAFGGPTGATVSIPAGTKARCVCFDGANYR